MKNLRRRLPGQSVLVATVMLLLAHTALAGIPDIYKPISVEPPFSFSQRVLELTPAIALARAQGKPMFLYLGAADCPPCVEYSRFLEKHSSILLDIYSRFIVVDFRTWIKGPSLKFKIGDKLYSYNEFNELVGAPKSLLLYPHFWLVGSDLKLIKLLPAYVKPFLELETHKDLLSVDEAKSAKGDPMLEPPANATPN